MFVAFIDDNFKHFQSLLLPTKNHLHLKAIKMKACTNALSNMYLSKYISASYCVYFSLVLFIELNIPQEDVRCV